MKKFSIQSLTNERLYLQCKIKDVLAEKEEYYAVNAIIDTGATGSAISVGLAEKLNLISAGKIYVESAAYNGYVDFYFLNISVSEFEVEKLCVCAYPNDNIGFLIGMDLLGQGSFSFKKVKDCYSFVFRISMSNLLDFNLRNLSIFSRRLHELLNCEKKDSILLNKR